MTIDLDALRAFSAGLLALGRAAHADAPGRLLHEALGALRPLVPFRSAWWGQCSDRGSDGPRRIWLHGRINLSPAFAQDWNRLADRDVFAHEWMRRPGAVARWTGYDDPVPEVEAFARRHALFHGMVRFLELPGSGLMFFVAIYRGEDDPGFGDAEAALFEEFTSHLLLHWRNRVQDLLLGRPGRPSDSIGLADARGELLYLGRRLGRAIQDAYPGWAGSTLPPALATRLAQAPGAVALGRLRLTLEPCGEGVALALDRSRRAAGLPPRERGVALMYAQGHSHKEIARALTLTPATVRTYLRSAYHHLGVRNKIELGDALRPTAARPQR